MFQEKLSNQEDIPYGENLASWYRLTLKVSQSANLLVTGSITKQGSKHIRRLLVKVAHAISRTRNSSLKRLPCAQSLTHAISGLLGSTLFASAIKCI
ncbi:MAG: IS110 family transposase [Desulfobacterium sp.]|nr:IS110 family transposase [Desulfobacterium sp.]